MQLAVEAIFLEMVLRVVAPGSSGISESQMNAMQDLAFDWILSADRYVEPRHVELASAREKVYSCALTPIASKHGPSHGCHCKLVQGTWSLTRGVVVLLCPTCVQPHPILGCRSYSCGITEGSMGCM